MSIERLEHNLFKAKEKESITALLLKHQLFSKEFLNIKETASESDYQQIAASLFDMCQDPTVRAIYKESNRQFPDCTTIVQALQKAFCGLKNYYPTIKLPKIYTMITDMSHDLYVSNALIVIGLDSFLGKNPRPSANLNTHLHTQEPYAFYAIFRSFFELISLGFVTFFLKNLIKSVL